MENILEHVFKIKKFFEVKGQVKTEKKKRWILRHQYLQSFEEPGNVLDGPPLCEKRLHRMFQAAKYGMQEGVLTGAFVGGCWGIYKFAAENLSLILLSAARDKSKDRPKEPQNEPPRDKPREGSKKSINKTPERSKTADGSEDKSGRGGSVKPNESVGSKVTSGSKTTRPNTVGSVDNNLSKRREKIEIVGYALIKTTGSTGADSISDSIKSEDFEDANAEPGRKEDPNAQKNEKTGEGGKSKTPTKIASRGISIGSAKRARNILTSKKSKSKIASSTDSQSEEKTLKSTPSKSDASRPSKTQERNPSMKTGSVASSKHNRASQGGTKNESFNENKPPEVKKRASRMSSKSGSRSRKNSQDDKTSKRSGTSKSVVENIIPEPSNIPSVLVDEDQISNGYISGVMSSVHQITKGPSKSAGMNARFSSNLVTEHVQNSPDSWYSNSNISEIGASAHSLSHESKAASPEENKSFYSDPSVEHGQSAQMRSSTPENVQSKPDSWHSVSDMSETEAAERRTSQASRGSRSGENESFYSQHSEPERSHTSGIIEELRKSQYSEVSSRTPDSERISDEKYPEPRQSNYGSVKKGDSSFVKSVASASTDNARSMILRPQADQGNVPAADKSGRFNLLSGVNENIIVVSACNFAIVFGVVFTVISTTRASLSI